MKKGSFDANVIVIGGGSAGLVTAYICALLKAKVILIEKHRMGGDCLNTGCVPSKALIRTASVLNQIRRHKEFGIRQADAQVDFAEVMERIQRVIRTVEPHDSVERYTALGVECITGEARILSPHEIQVSERVFRTKSIVVATGASPSLPQIPGLEAISAYNTDTIWSLRKKPERLLVLGGGPIGCELGQAFARLGIQVIQIQRDSQILSREDAQVAELVEHRLKEEGVDVRLNTRPLSFEIKEGRKVMTAEREGQPEEIGFDEALVAVGRKPRTQGFGLEEIGVKTDDRGRIAVDEYARTSIKNIFACGDVASPYQFTHMAAHQAWYCAVNALFQPIKKFKMDLNWIPWCTFTDPEVARFGLNEKEAKKNGIAYEVASYDLGELDRAIADDEAYGTVKVLTPPKKDKILGVTICGAHAGDLLIEFLFAAKHGFGLNAILNTTHIYPTMAEANKFAAGAWKKNHAPQKILNLLGIFHSFRRSR